MRCLLVLSTAPNKKSARKIADVLVGRKLAACVSFGKGWESVFRWKGKAAVSNEILLLIKTSSAKIKPLQKTLLQIHPYEIPEILVLSDVKGSPKYLSWIFNSIK